MRKGVLVLVVATIALLGAPVAYGNADPSELPAFWGPPEAYVGTDYSVVIEHPGEAGIWLVMERPQGCLTAALEDLSPGDPSTSIARLPGKWFTQPGPVTLVLYARDANGAVQECWRRTVLVKMPAASAALGDSQLGPAGIEFTSTRWFYDVDRNGNMLNGINISSIAAQVKSPIRDSTGNTEQWPSINFSHNTPEAGTDSGAVQPHRGLDIARSNTQEVWAVIGGTVVTSSSTNHIVTTMTDLNSDGSYDLWVQYEHITPLVAVGAVITQSTKVGTVFELNHVHIRFDDPSRFSMPQRLFWLDSPWATAPTGLDVDFIRKPTAGSGVIAVKIHGWNAGTHQYGASTKLYHRGLGDPSFIATNMVQQADQITWRADISSYYSPGETIEYYVETMRSDLSGSLNAQKKVYRPVYYKMDWDGTKWVGVPPVEYWLTTR